MGIVHQSVPISSSLLLTPEDRKEIFNKYAELNPSLRRLLVDPKTGAYIRGLTKEFQLHPAYAPRIALVILRIAVGILDPAKMGATLSTELQLSNDTAQHLARELEKDLISPLSIAFGQQKTKKATQQDQEKSQNVKRAGARNVLNLKRKQPPQA